ncbi:MAG: serpin family protein [Clostridiaceae bacterium]|nr:serpin family protein [Clostridiaceae bacterium]
MRNRILILIFVFAIILAGCTATGYLEPGPKKAEGTENASDIEAYGTDEGTETGSPEMTGITEESEVTEATETETGEEIETPNIVIRATRKFAWNLFREINEEDQDKEIFISPFSVSSVLMMAYNGAGGTTRDAMAEAMYCEGIPIDELNEDYRDLISRLSSLDEKVKIEIANSIWSRQGFEIQKNFIGIGRNYFLSDVESLDFAEPGSANIINSWVAEKTHNLIPSVISPPIPDEVMVYLINAIYFKGEWTEAFKAERTFETDFHSYDGRKDRIQMMQKEDRIELAESNEYRAVSLPYGDKKTAMMVILPGKDINQFIKNFDDEKWDAMLESLRPVNDLHLQLPKFKMEYGIRELNSSLTALGMGEIFSERADFSGIARDIYISSVLHKAVVDVNEEGTEAAAATVIEFETTSFIEPVRFIADRPFLFVIYDTGDRNILFVGKKLFGDR